MSLYKQSLKRVQHSASPERMLVLATIKSALENIESFFRKGESTYDSRNSMHLLQDWKWVFREDADTIYGSLKNCCLVLGLDYKKIRRIVLTQPIPERYRSLLPRYTDDGFTEGG